MDTDRRKKPKKVIRNPFQVADAHRLFRDKSRNKENSVGGCDVHDYVVPQFFGKNHSFEKSVIICEYYLVYLMTPLLQLIHCAQNCEITNQVFPVQDIDLISQTVLYLNSVQPIDWHDGDFYDLPEALAQISKEKHLKDMPLELLQALETVYALLPEAYNQTKGLLQNAPYTAFVDRVLQVRPEEGLVLLEQGMKNGRHLYTLGDNLSFETQAAIVTRFGTDLLKMSDAKQYLVRYLNIFQDHHDRIETQRLCQILLYEAVSDARVDVFDVLLERMSLQSPATKIASLLTREELCSMAWMRKADQMNSVLYNSFLPREQCTYGSFDARVWDLMDWMEQRLTPDTAQNVARGICVLADRLCCMNEDNIEDVLQIKTQQHPIFCQLWNHPILEGYRTEIVASILQNIQTHNLPYNSGCEVAWMLYEQLSEDEKHIPQDLMAVLQQYPPYAQLQLNAVVSHIAPQRFSKKM